MLIPAFIYFVLACAVGYVAKRRGRNAAGWFIGSLIFTPLFTFIVLLLCKRLG